MPTVTNTEGIPPLVLAGRIPKYKSVNTAFLSGMIQEWYRRAWRSYTMRSDLGGAPNMNPKGTPKIGKADDEGRTWHQLRPRTYKIKAKLQSSGKYTRYLSKIKSKGAEAALGVITNMDYGSGDGTNIRTGRTLAAFAVPYRVGTTLAKGPDQIIEINDNKVKIDVRHGYAVEVLYGVRYGRALFDGGVEDIWWNEAVNAGLKAARIEYDRLVARFGEPEYINQVKRARRRSR